MHSTHASLAGALGAALLLASAPALAGPREECLEAHSRAQDQRERGQLARARQTFLACAQSSCPALVQADCAKTGDELGQLVPTVTFSARDASAADLPATSVFVDDVLVASRLDDGKTYELDPGRHVVRWVHDGRETSTKVILSQGEKGRLLVATFAGSSVAAGARRDHEAPHEAAEVVEPPRAEPSRSRVPLVVAGVGGAGMIAGGVLLGVGLANVPSRCSVSTHDCAGPSNDPALGDASSGVRLANLGLAIGVTGAVTLVTGLVWYFLTPPTWRDARATHARSPSPFVVTF